MKRAVIIHCWEGYPEYCWYPQAKKELESLGFKVAVPEMPDTNHPKLSEWLPELRKVAGIPDEGLYLVGHSLGVITILRYLESLKEGEKIGGAVFVAGFSEEIEYEEIMNFFKVPVDFDKVKTHCSKFVVIHSDNDPYVPLRFGEFFKKELGAKLIVLHNKGHFSGEIENEESCTTLPEVVEEITVMAAG